MHVHVEEIAPLVVAERLRSSDEKLLLLDCRETEELAICRIAGAAHVAMSEIERRHVELDRSRDVVVFCHRGARSFNVAAFLKQLGFPSVASLRGGIDAWSTQVDPSVTRY